MELIKSAARRSRLGEVGHIALNLLYAGLLLLLVTTFYTPILAYLIVLLSKWRVFAVRPRFWLTNIQANMLDALLGVSVVTLLWQNSGTLLMQLAVTAMYSLWLIFLKPSSKRMWVVTQAAVVQFVSLMALFSIVYMVDLVVVVIFGGLIGYIVAHHIIHMFSDEYEDVFLSLIWALVIAELSWLTFYWTIAYTPLKIPQISIVASLLGYMALVVYSYLYGNEGDKISRRDLTMPTIFSLVGILLILVFFNGFDPTSL